MDIYGVEEFLVPPLATVSFVMLGQVSRRPEGSFSARERLEAVGPKLANPHHDIVAVDS